MTLSSAIRNARLPSFKSRSGMLQTGPFTSDLTSCMRFDVFSSRFHVYLSGRASLACRPLSTSLDLPVLVARPFAVAHVSASTQDISLLDRTHLLNAAFYEPSSAAISTPKGLVLSEIRSRYAGRLTLLMRPLSMTAHGPGELEAKSTEKLGTAPQERGLDAKKLDNRNQRALVLQRNAHLRSLAEMLCSASPVVNASLPLGNSLALRNDKRSSRISAPPSLVRPCGSKS
jgi:hypothetical protein